MILECMVEVDGDFFVCRPDPISPAVLKQHVSYSGIHPYSAFHFKK